MSQSSVRRGPPHASIRVLACTTALASLPLAAFAQGTATPRSTILLEEVVVEGGTADAGSATGGTPAGASAGELVTDGYVAGSTVSATKTDLPVVRVPQSVTVVTEEELRDRNVQSLTQALTYSSAARVGAFGLDPRFDSFFIRGFDATYTGVFRDGLREFSNGFTLSQVEPYGLGGISVLKGPSSGLYGSSNTGGIIDLRSKRPTVETLREVELQVGSNERYQANFDASGAFAGSDVAFYRLTGVARDSDTDNPFVSDDALLIAPAFTYTPTGDTSLTILGELQKVRTGGTAVYLQDGRDVSGIPYADPNFNDLDQVQGRIGYEFEHRVNDNLIVRQKARYSDNDLYGEYVFPLGTIADPILPRGTGVVEQTLKAGVADNQIEAKFETGALAHTLTGGLDGYYAEYTNREGFGSARGLNLATPDYGLPIATPDYTLADAQDQTQVGLYLQDVVEIDRLTLVLGGRHDWVWTNPSTGVPGALVDGLERSEEEFTGRVGASYLFDSGIAPYAAYATAFSPNIGFAADGSVFDATTAEQFEAGVKYQPQGTPLFLSASVFQIDQKNGVFLQPSADFSTSVQVQLDELRGRGFELEGSTGFENGLNLTLSYTYLDLEIVEGVPGTEGNEISSRPNHTFGAYADYTVQSGVAKGFGLGAGLRYVGSSFGNDRNTFKNDARVFIDAAVHYEMPQIEGLRLQINATNLFDEDAALCTEGFCYQEAERNVIGSLRYRF